MACSLFKPEDSKLIFEKGKYHEVKFVMFSLFLCNDFFDTVSPIVWFSIDENDLTCIAHGDL